MAQLRDNPLYDGIIYKTKENMLEGVEHNNTKSHGYNMHSSTVPFKIS